MCAPSQDPTLFSGTIRENVDPFNSYSDSELWAALGRAQMKDSIEAMPEQLDTPVGDGGEAFSVGERQLLCLARSILAEAKLLIMDECTASVDVQTDAKIQTMVRGSQLRSLWTIPTAAVSQHVFAGAGGLRSLHCIRDRAQVRPPPIPREVSGAGRPQCNPCSQMCYCHRLDTIIDCEKTHQSHTN